jgi:nucleotide-binding universal stress UspA family protein
MYADVLIPTDGSEGVQAAIDHGIELARRYDATVHGLYVVDTRVSRSGPLHDVLRDEGQDAVRAVELAGARAGVAVTTHVREGVPHEEILRYVADHGVDFVVVGTEGRSGLDRILMGSVAERVVRLSPVPVLTVGPGRSSRSAR